MRALRAVLLLPLLVGCGPRSEVGDDAGMMQTPRDAAPFVPQMVLTSVVIDGDTILVDAGADLKAPDGQPLDGQRIRFIGIDAPEIEHPPEPADCYGDEAKAFLDDQIGGKIIELSYDTGNIRDDFGRLLAYVKRMGVVVNETMISTGNATAFRRYPHPERSRYIALEQEAKDQMLGLWACP